MPYSSDYISYDDWLNQQYGSYWAERYKGLGYYQDLYNKSKLDYDTNSILTKIRNGDMTGLVGQGELSGIAANLSPEQTSWLSNLISEQSKQQSQDWEERMRDTQISSSASQYSALGLNPGTVAGSSLASGIGSPNAANVDMSNPAMQREEMEFQRKNMIAKSLLSLVSGMASAGAYGFARGAAIKAINKVGSSMANSAGNMIKGHYFRGSIY